MNILLIIKSYLNYLKKGGKTMSNSMTILIVDDIEVDRVVLRECLHENYSILEASNGYDALNLLNQYHSKITAIILDILMPVMDGYTLMKKIHENCAFNKIPIIISTSSDDIKSSLNSLGLYAEDIIEKPIEPTIIKNRVENIILKTQLEYHYNYDRLTGIYNSHSFEHHVKNLLKNNPMKNYVVIRFDIEQFKIINDLFGRDKGDELLKFIASKLKIIIGSKGIYARIQGDVFAICLEHNSSNNEYIISSINNCFDKYPLNFKISPCFGLYIVEKPDESIDHMLDLANLASKTVKENYLIRYAYYNEDIRNSLINKYEIISDMNSALEHNQFIIYFQPKYDLNKRKISGAEALVRWMHPVKGMISPGDFIPIFEKNGFILKLDHYILEKACQHIQKWLNEGRDIPPISINLSRMNLYNTNLCDDILKCIRKYDVPVNLIELEITESAYMQNAKELINTANTLRSYGFKILMDDFGSGYSSLNVLKDMTVDVLKIDMLFLSNDTNSRSNIIIKSVIDMAKALNLETIAEGVETIEQVEFLTNSGCDSIQGYFYSKPLSVDQYELLLENPKII